jgi:hypothetical protein
VEVSFKFNNGETGQEMVASILALFGASISINNSTPQRENLSASQLIAAHTAPLPGTAPQDADDTGTPSAATHDAEGTPWDARIHSDKRTMTDKNIWRKRKSVPPTVVTGVMNELRTKGLILTPAASAPAALPGMPAMPPMAPLAPLAPVETPYQKLVDFIANNMHSAANPAGRFTPDWISGALKQYGIVGTDGNGHLQVLENAPAENVTAVHQAFAAAIGATV